MNNYIEQNGNKYWYLENDIQRPYVSDFDDINGQLYIKGKLCHREGGPAIEYSDGRKDYYQYGKLHRIGGPAIEGLHGYLYGYKTYFENGKHHREDGPAIEWANGDIEYWLCNKRFNTKEDWEHYRDYLIIME